MPLSCSLLVLAPDPHTLYGELVQKYFIAQGLACGQNICIIDDDAKNMAQECMWKTGDHTPEHENESDTPHDEIKIAWRYAQIGKFQTTVSALYVFNPSIISSMIKMSRHLGGRTRNIVRN